MSLGRSLGPTTTIATTTMTRSSDQPMSNMCALQGEDRGRRRCHPHAAATLQPDFRLRGALEADLVVALGFSTVCSMIFVSALAGVSGLSSPSAISFLKLLM